MERLRVIGGGLAGCEAAWQAAERGVGVDLFEMRPARQTGAHRTGGLAELVCSNSFGSRLPDRASGVLMGELRLAGSLLLRCAEAAALPAGGALAVDREGFSRRVGEALEAHPLVRVRREEAAELPPGPCVVASGPLTSARLSGALAGLLGEEHLYFFDALAPIVRADSIDRSVAFRASRYGRGTEAGGDYLNCPFSREAYDTFVRALREAECHPLRAFEEAIPGGVRAGAGPYFEGCLPVEVLAARGERALAFGPMRPVGLHDPRTGRRPHAVLQLRRDDAAGELYNLVGFQTNLRRDEQDRVFRLVPGLARAVFVRYGEMHRNTFLNAPRCLRDTLQLRARGDAWVAGQLSGVEGYLGNVATGLVAGVNAARAARGAPTLAWPPETMTGALCRYVASAPPAHFQPMKANLGLLPDLGEGAPRGGRDRAAAHAARALAAARGALEAAGEPRHGEA